MNEYRLTMTLPNGQNLTSFIHLPDDQGYLLEKYAENFVRSNGIKRKFRSQDFTKVFASKIFTKNAIVQISEPVELIIDNGYEEITDEDFKLELNKILEKIPFEFRDLVRSVLCFSDDYEWKLDYAEAFSSNLMYAVNQYIASKEV